MALYRLKEYYPNYTESTGDNRLDKIDSFSVYTQPGQDKVGSVKDLLVDESGRFRYVVVDTGPWIFGKTVLLPIGLANFDYNNERIYVNGLSKEQVENLPEYKDYKNIDEKYETNVRNQYKPMASSRSSRQFINRTDGPMQPLEDQSATLGTSSASLNQQRNVDVNAGAKAKTDAYDYDRDPDFYGLSEEDNHGPLRLYEERLITHRNRFKAGEVTLGKRVESKAVETDVPVERERVVIERRDVGSQPVAADAVDFRDQEIARVDVYGEEVNVEKQAVVREEVSLRKEKEQDTVHVKDQVRREELDVDTHGNPDVLRQ
jgi:uncharacterized protein (TIGR02271 family)